MYKFIFSFFIAILIFNHALYSQTFERQILSSTDDAEESVNTSFVTTSSSDIEMMYDTWNNQELQTLGFRFDNITIPSNSTITNSYVQFTADGSNSGSLNLSIYGENIGSSAPFSSNANNISNRNTTASNIDWNSIPNWIDDQSGVAQRTPDLTIIISEVMTSNGWQSGNPITLIMTGNGSETQLRKSYSFDGNSTKSAKLIIEYTSNTDVDLAISSSITPYITNYPNAASEVQVEVFSYGNLLASNYSLSYSIDGNLIATEPGVTPLSIGQSVIFTFAQTVNLNTIGNYSLSVELTIIDDENIANNTITKSISVINEVDSLYFNSGSSWRFWDNTTTPGTAWNTITFNDAAWPVGLGQFGFNENDEETNLNEGLISYYFRKKVQIADVTQLDKVFLHLIHDEAAIIFINGQEVLRSELMPLGIINHTTVARQTNNNSTENEFYTYKIDANYFSSGENTIAISIHNRNASDEDVSFDCFVTPDYLYSQDGPYVYYDGNTTIVEEVTPNGLISNSYTVTDNLELTCYLPHMNTSFSFFLKPEILIEPSVYTDTPSKFLAISDFDGHIEGFTMVLKGEGIIDDNFNWIYGDGHLIISGDLFDRGYNITECMWLLYKLESEAELVGGKVHLIIGNHEMFNMTDDWRYVEVKYFNNAHLMGKRMPELYDSNTELGRWLRSKNIIEKIGDYAAMHGGLSPTLLNLDLTYQEINDYGRIEMNSGLCNSECEVVNGSDGVYWYRGMVEEDLSQQQVDVILDSFHVNRVILGHTKANTIRTLYDDKVIAIDMYHIDNFNNGFMEALQFELGCFYLFHTDATNENYNLLFDCDEFNGIAMNLNGDNQLQIYPNPTSEILNIKLPTSMIGEYDYTVYNFEGKLISQGKISSEITTINVQSFTTGKYILTLKNTELTIKGQFILMD